MPFHRASDSWFLLIPLAPVALGLLVFVLTVIRDR
jgi:hypothetical protein